MRTIRAEIFIEGRVQGVGFRAFARRKAQENGVFGWVANVGDSQVKAVLEGPEDGVEKIIQLLHEGPTGARVDRVEVSFNFPATGEFTSFEISAL